MEAIVTLSVVVPVYNEEGSIEALVQDLERDVVAAVEGVEVIVVDDASTDGTPALLDRLAEGRPWLDVRHAEQNAGHGAAVLRGLALARGEWIFQIDSDGQFRVDEFPRLWERRSECDLALGVRANRHDPRHRLVLTRAVRLAVTLLAGRPIRDVNTPFRLLRRELWNTLSGSIPSDTLAPNIFVTVGASVRGARIVDVPVTHLAREQGTSTLRTMRLIRFSLRGLRQLVAFRFGLARAPKGAGLPVETAG
jgi:dolichol-phosphate mannosyltransferase